MNNTTKLEAINRMLATIGESPVTTLDGDQTADVALAVQILNDNTRFVQNAGFGFNTDYDYPLPRNEDNKINIPDNVSHVEFKYDGSINPVRRGTLVWDRKGRTFYFSKDIVALRIIWTLDFEDLPQAARDYISIRAAREFASKVMPDQTTLQVTAQDELTALSKLRNDENRSENRGFGVDTRITNRNHGIR